MRMMLTRGAALALVLVAGQALAQAASPFGGFRHDRTQPIEIAADSLEVREGEKIAIFRGDVVAGQGTLRLTADELTVNYGDGGAGSGQIRRLEARGDVFLANEAETAAGDFAEYDVAAGTIRMTGGVTLTQGGNVVRGETLSIDLNSGEGRVGGGGGRVKSVFEPSPKAAD
ncbi:lipopolysaccharide transport periplasmic protein LptA [Pikeienuella sp. HZG-20]|uniref:lipopolysaccharide transport periplasmic protein LptA n=1 Tax=Paludibacillus litoralis TaxID=3133267 RepID=UPI0030ECA2AD